MVLSDNLERQAHDLAASQQQTRRETARLHFVSSIKDYRAVFLEAAQRMRNANEQELAQSYAAEWILDNDFLAITAFRQVDQDLPANYDHQLPRLLNGPLAGSPRVYALGRELVTSSRAQLDLGQIERFVQAYQTVTPLTMGELWALPIMLRIGILQALTQSAAHLTENMARLEQLPAPVIVWDQGVTDDEIIANSFLSLRAISAEEWKDFFERVSLVEQILSGDPVHIYASMDFPTRDTYRKVVEVLALNAGKDEQDVARLAVHLAQEHYDQQVHSQVVRMAAPVNFLDLETNRRGHVGYYLLDQGRSQVEQQIGYRLSAVHRLERWLFQHARFAYLGSIGLLVTLVLAGLTAYTVWAGGSGLSILLVWVLGLVLALTAVVHFVNWLVTHRVPPHILPKLDCEQALPAGCAALVVVPAFLESSDETRSLLSQIELHYLRNMDELLWFALLTDFPDANEENLPGDEALVQEAVQGIQALNRKYARANGDPFLLLHRPRLWNPAEQKWMGWERKRGKLHELNRMILEAARQAAVPAIYPHSASPRTQPSSVSVSTSPLGSLDTSQIDPQTGALTGRRMVRPPGRHTGFSVQEGNLDILAGVRYVVTLDADTILPLGSACRLVATLAHPLNQAEFDPDGRIRSGYTILQPRTRISPTSAVKSVFTSIFSGDAGLDLYTLAVSDVYQDLFGEGIYVGKGIYDVVAFERSLAGRVPDETMLSHDLFEGIQGRTALVSDIILIEDYPSCYMVQVRRMHRWIRGDWQLVPWLLPQVPTDKGYRPNNLSGLDRWKILDNLRRSLVTPVLLVYLAAAWLGLLPGPAWVWTAFGVVTLAMPLLTSLGTGLFQAARKSSGFEPFRGALRSMEKDFVRLLLAVAFLPFEAILVLNAVLVSLGRVFISHRNLLRWTTNAQVERRSPCDASWLQVWQEMGVALLVSAILALLVAIFHPQALLAAAPLLILWFLSPELVLYINRPLRQPLPPLSTDQNRQLRLLARRTWLFFEQFVGPEDHWLPPDHFQESPLGQVAHRTSPTNMGLNLLAILGAYDLGYIGLLGLTARLRSSFDTLSRLERYRGHFLNWYDTRSLEPLQPGYVSTVDSGNLAASLIALRQGLLGLDQAIGLRQETLSGLLDAIELLAECLIDLEKYDSRGAASRSINILAQIRRQIESVEAQPKAWSRLLFGLSTPRGADNPGIPELEQALLDLAEGGVADLSAETLSQLRLYAGLARQRLENAQREIEVLAPWWKWLAHPPELFAQLALQTLMQPELDAAWQNLEEAFPVDTPVGRIREVVNSVHPAVDRLRLALEGAGESAAGEARSKLIQAACDWLEGLEEDLQSASLSAAALFIGLQELANEAQEFTRHMDFNFLLDPQRQVFHIGYNLALGRLDDNYYDLIASEARIASLVAISRGEAPQSHWLHLARPLSQVDGHQTLLSWSGTMFEYLMPLILVRNYMGTLLDMSMYAAVDAQIAYGSSKSVPWGISESGYFRFDPGQAYQYRAFGVPGLGYKRGLGDDLVIAPYASLLALPLAPQAVAQNLDRLVKLGAMGVYGLYEALDFTPTRLLMGDPFELVREYMAHHQGMIFVTLVNHFLDDRMVQRFHADPQIRSVEMLLQEQIPADAPLEQPHVEDSRSIRPPQPQVVMNPWRVRVNAPQPRLHFLSNGRYGVLITAAGGGYSTWGDLDLTRWRADTTLGGWGNWIYVQNLEDGRLWSVGYEPALQRPDSREVNFNAHMVTFARRDGEIATSMDVVVAPDEDVEIRLITLTNHSQQPQRLRLTSYAEVVLAPSAGDRRHPAFSKLFVESEYFPANNALLFRRRPRSEKDEVVTLAHSLAMRSDTPITQAFESDRARFLGRGRTVHNPQALLDGSWLSGSAGATLDPIMSLGQELILEEQASLQVAFITLVAPSHQEALEIVRRYQVWHTIERAFALARSAAEVELRRLGMHTSELVRIQRLLSGLLYPNASLRAPAETLQANRKGQPGLWPYAISGDYPILLARMHTQDDLALVQELLQAHAYWRNRNLKIDLVILNEQGQNYGQELTAQFQRMLASTGSDAWLNRRGGIFLLAADRISPEDRVLIESAARVILDGNQGGLAGQLPGGERLPSRLPAFAPSLPDGLDVEPTPPLERPVGLLFDNGLGGFSADGKEYQIYLEPGRPTPAPWINVIANPDFGFLTSDTGLGYTWAANSGENRLTPWSNDPVSDPPGEALYLRDEETAVVWSPTPLPAPAPAPYCVHHGAGYTRFEHASHGLKQQVRLFAAPDQPVKIVQVRLENLWPRVRRVTLTYYVEWVLGVNRDEMQQYIIPEFDVDTQALLAFNPYNIEFGERVAFAAASQKLHGLTADRTEFFGRLGDRAQPAALHRIGLSGVMQPGLDPCAALQLHLDLQPGQAQEVYFLLGQGASREEALNLVHRFQDLAQVEAAWQAVEDQWEHILDAVSVHTPDPAMDIVLNRWLLYQALSGRIWGRSALYQSSGAFGFRDQLQDVMALVYAAPDLARQHLLHSASHQFEAGDVLHWWHPPSGRGVRTRFSDDLLWLPYVTAFYVAATGDTSVLDDGAPFLTGPQLEPGEDEHYGLYTPTPKDSTLYEHCLRAIEKGSTSGSHGLPLIGSGDWNDGMNRVGNQGKGESVWLAWFLISVLREFAGLCDRRGEKGQAERLRQRAEQIAQAVEAQAWDGAWYIRAFYDDGTPLGSAQSRECKIDSIAQSWAVLSQAGDPQHMRQAMESVFTRLVRPDERLILLFTPPFDRTPRDPGYIKGYVPGVRENGGQYTHAAVWTAWAMARLGLGDRAQQLFRQLNSIEYADTYEKAIHYKVEPYVVVADVYSVPPHTGRGGWTWYTGSAGWLYRLGIEAILGLHLEGDAFRLEPCIPRSWPGFEMVYRQDKTVYHIQVQNPDSVSQGVRAVHLDGQTLPEGKIPLAQDGQQHEVLVVMGIVSEKPNLS